jgi:hypothetical protein
MEVVIEQSQIRMREEPTPNGSIYFITKWREEEMKPFKFLHNPIAITHDGGDIYVEQLFYTMNKEEIVNYTYMGERRVTPKYTIVTRYVQRIYEDKFKPDYESLWYFRSKQNAEYLKTLWEREDKEVQDNYIIWKKEQ